MASQPTPRSTLTRQERHLTRMQVDTWANDLTIYFTGNLSDLIPVLPYGAKNARSFSQNASQDTTFRCPIILGLKPHLNSSHLRIPRTPLVSPQQQVVRALQVAEPSIPHPSQSARLRRLSWHYQPATNSRVVVLEENYRFLPPAWAFSLCLSLVPRGSRFGGSTLFSYY